MPEADPQPVDLWKELDDAAATVATWPDWQQRYDADVADVAEGETPNPT